jgi:hypothetical protein
MIYINETVGGTDFEVDIEIKNKEELSKLIDTMKLQFPEIRKVSILTVSKYHKLDFFID